MDPFAHTFAGAALAASGLRRVTPLATAALLIGVNAPDVDVVMMFAGDYMDLAHRRGLTHGIPALLILPFLVTALLLGWDRWVRRRLDPGAAPIDPRGLLLVSAIAVISHPLLDWLNNYGMRWLMPFDGRWSYGDALFIIDPVAWLGLGGAAFLAWSRHPAAIAVWAVFWVAASWLVFTNDLVPDAARWLWLAGIALLLVVRLGLRRRCAGAADVARPAQLALLGVGLYMLANVAANIPARAEVRAVLAAQGLDPVSEVMVAPMAAN
ncbi:MAG: metal-dependent hydrolase, partial [Bacteroidales bacterium]|nr:metal-dependent hydrolase [Bacteroidales bacterium]